MPDGLEVEAVAAPGEFESTSKGTAVSVIPMPGEANRLVIALKDRTDSNESLSASVARSGFSAMEAELRFQFYTPSAHRNGSLLVRLLNREGECLASFALYAKQHEMGELLLNTFAAQSERRTPGDADVYLNRTWTPVALKYNGSERLWSLAIGERAYSGLSVDALVLDPAVARFEIHTGFGKATNTLLYLDEISFETLQ